MFQLNLTLNIGAVKLYTKWSHVADKSECSGSEISKPLAKDIESCAKSCKGISYMFAFGTSDWGTIRCFPEGCKCYCETAANKDGTCNLVSHNGMRLFKYENGKILSKLSGMQ